jgi:hypothetical protein
MRIYPQKNQAADYHRRRSIAAGLLSLCALHEKVPRRNRELVAQIRDVILSEAKDLCIPARQANA